jgi:phosphoribosylformimino-5-aminoimidazole carboxamide ribotide isomerase
VRVRGWKDARGISATELALQMRLLGLQTVIHTDIGKDGLSGGLNITATCKLSDVSGLDIIASGGVHTADDVLAARDANLSGVIIGRALYEGTIELKEMLKGAANAC